jgi:hypothetical protein
MNKKRLEHVKYFHEHLLKHLQNIMKKNKVKLSQMEIDNKNVKKQLLDEHLNKQTELQNN